MLQQEGAGFLGKAVLRHAGSSVGVTLRYLRNVATPVYVIEWLRYGTKESTMKISFDIDCTPEEARRFFGLPDVSPVNDAFVKELTKRAGEMAQEMDAGKLMEQWMSAGVQGFGDIQEAFMEQFAKAQGGKD